jgi:hypothetical protein
VWGDCGGKESGNLRIGGRAGELSAVILRHYPHPSSITALYGAVITAGRDICLSVSLSFIGHLSFFFAADSSFEIS